MPSHTVKTCFKENRALADQEINRRPGKTCDKQAISDQTSPAEDQNHFRERIIENIIYGTQREFNEFGKIFNTLRDAVLLSI
jgi:hypothetical protein